MARKRRSREEMSALIARRETEGLTWAALVAGSGVPLSTLTYWRRKLEEESIDAPFVELVVEPDSSSSNALSH